MAINEGLVASCSWRVLEHTLHPVLQSLLTSDTTHTSKYKIIRFKNKPEPQDGAGSWKPVQLSVRPLFPSDALLPPSQHGSVCLDLHLKGFVYTNC